MKYIIGLILVTVILIAANETIFHNGIYVKGSIESTDFTNGSRVMTSDADSELAESSVTTTTLGYLDATSSIQTQLDTKLESDLNPVLLGSGAATTSAGSVVIGANAGGAFANSVAIGSYADSSGSDGTAIGDTAKATYIGATAVGATAVANGLYSVALGRGTLAALTDSVAIGGGAASTHANSMALGYDSLTTAANQIMMGTSSETVHVPGVLELASGTTVNEISTDTSFAGDSDDAIPTEKAVKAYVDAGGSAGNPIDTLISDTLVGSVGDVGQHYAGHNYDDDEGGQTDVAYYKFASGALTTDETATYTLTNNGTITGTTGIMGDSFAASFNGSSQYFTQGTLADSVGGSFVIDFWISPTDCNPSAVEVLFSKENIALEDNIQAYLSTDGEIVFQSEENNNGNKSLFSSLRLPDGACGWNHILFSLGTTGKSIYINSVLSARDSTETTVFNDGTATSFFIGSTTSPSLHFAGDIGLFRYRNFEITQKDVDLAYATKVDISGASFSTTNYQLWSTVKEDNSSNFLSQLHLDEVHRSTSDVYFYGGQLDSADSFSLFGRE